MRYTISLTLSTLLLAHAAAAEVPRVVTDIPPVHSLVAMVMGDLGQPVLLVDKGADAHSFQLRPSQAAALQDADLVVWMGDAMTPWLGSTLDGLETRAAQIALLEDPLTQTRHLEDDHAGHDLAAQAHDDGGHDHDGIDPHAWLDPANAIAWVGLIAASLSTLDPENAATYAANASASASRIAAAEADATALLAPVKASPFVVYHDAYGYFTARFGLTIVGELALGDASGPSAAKLADLREILVNGKAVCLFPEANHDPVLLTQIAEGTPVAVGRALDPEGSGLPPGPALYTNLLRGLATTLADCLSRT